METRVSPTKWHGVEAWSLAGPDLGFVTVPIMGAKIVSLQDLRDGTEWLVGPGPRPFRPALYGASFTEQDMSGWDEMFPTVIACPYPGPGAYSGVSLPDHGEAWALPWQIVQAGEARLTLALEGRALPYRLTRTADLPAPAVLRLRYTLQNLGADPMPYLWAAHPQFTCDADGQFILPTEVTEVINTIPASWGWGPPETRFDWPQATSPGGKPVRLDLIGPPDLKRGRKFFTLPYVRPSWAALLRRSSGRWLRFEWEAEHVPHLGLWVDEGAFSHDSVAAIEPMTAWYDDLALASEKGLAPILPAGESHSWSLTVHLGQDGSPEPDKRITSK